MRKSLTAKMFLITFLCFMLMIIIIFFVQTFYFNNFYETKRINNIINNINNFSLEYVKNNWSQEELFRQVDRFSSSNNVTLNIINNYRMSHSSISHDTISINLIDDDADDKQYMITIIDSEEIYRDFFINKTDLRNAFGELNLSKGTRFTVHGYLNGIETVNPIKINGIDVGVENNYGNQQNQEFKELVTFVDMKEFSGRSSYSSSIYEQNKYSEELTEFKLETLNTQKTAKKNGVSYTISDIPYTNFKQVDFTKTIELEKGEEKVIYVNASLQSVDEAMKFINDYYPYFFILAMGLSFIIAMIYSKTVSKPLINITSAANKMANMDFDVKLDVKREDELGILSNSLNTLSVELETSLNELTHANNQLKLDYEKEKKQEKVRKEFVANVSHELKTPLGIVKGFAEGIKDGIKEEKKEYYIEVILDEVRKMDSLVMEMLRLSKFDAEAITFNKKDFDLRDMVVRVVRIFDKSLDKKNLKIDIIGELNVVNGDKGKLEQVLINLIGNAIKYCNDNSTIIIKGELYRDKNIISIENDCKPFTDEEKEKIWNRFYKTDKSHNRDQGGIGLGLSITKAILEGHGCEYGVENTETGVRFYFSVPAKVVM